MGATLTPEFDPKTPLPGETHNAVVYGFCGMFKLIIMTFNVEPWIALTIVA